MHINEKWMCAVSVATVWTDPDSPRVADLPALDHPVQMDRWLSHLSYEERLALSEKNQIQTQLLYGEPVIVEDVVGDWARIVAISQQTRKDPRGYPGWVPLVQLSMRERIRAEEFVRVSNPKAALFDESGTFFLRVSFNTIFPSGERRGKKLRVWTPHGWKLLNASDVETVGEESIHRTLTLGRRFMGLPYLWGVCLHGALIARGLFVLFGKLAELVYHVMLWIRQKPVDRSRLTLQIGKKVIYSFLRMKNSVFIM
ncbi:hypothetical protein SporoP32a_08530 [Sporosarcina ureae]|nr:hypothetical protein [Sporosarcina ureae]ARK21574.1 hypothetical protein SporoP32a_08530 [Sporosarcina ureae]